MKRICVFCGSAPGNDPEFVAAASDLGQILAQRGIEVIYGGGRVGMMGALADSALAAGGRVHGVIPRAMVRLELAHDALTELHVVETMHERKALMAEMADAFVAMPGGFGTLDELFEALTWSQLGIHDKPCGLLNTRGYFDSLLDFLDRAVNQGFIPAGHRSLLFDDSTATVLVDNIEAMTHW
ncbi:MAG TPA: TIGR00730 family Rossman fold protein [Myxococcota bacterium]|nr:TIGR00730 family Rossman fold protein [Myxococcota bacterium]